MKIKLTPPTFNDQDLRNLSQSAASCSNAIPRLIRLLQQVRSFGFCQIEDLPPPELEVIQRLASVLDSEISLTLYLLLVEAGVVVDQWIDLELLADFCKFTPPLPQTAL